MLLEEPRKIRIEPLTLDQLDPETRADAEKYLRRNGFVPTSFLTMARRPEVVRAYVALRGAIEHSLTIPAYLRIMMFNVSSLTTGCRYCQAHSIRNLFNRHLDEVPIEKVEALWDFEVSDLFTDAERVALRFAQASASIPNAVTDAHMADLKRHYSDDQIVEMVGLLAFGAFLNRLNDTLALALEEVPEQVTSDLLGARGWQVGKHARVS